MASKVWQPVEDGAYHYQGNDVMVQGNLLGVAQHGKRIYAGALPYNIRLCELIDAPAPVPPPDEVREAAMRASAWLVDMLNDYRGDGMDDLRADVITWRQWLDAQPADDA